MNEETGVKRLLLIAAGSALLLLPFVRTFNDWLAGLAIGTGLAGPLEALVPAQARVVVGVLGVFGVQSVAAGDWILVRNWSGQVQPLLISWNCIGWQSLVLFALSLLTGLRGSFSSVARLQVVAIGLLGTVILNLLRVAMVGALAATVGELPAVLFHDYGGTLLVIGWLWLFWALAFRSLLPVRASEA